MRFRWLQPFPKFYLHAMHACMQSSRAWRRLDSAYLKWIFCEGEKCYACQFECDCSSGPQDCGWCVFGAIFRPDIWPRMITACTVYTLMVNQVQNNSTLAVGMHWPWAWKPKFYLHSGCWIGLSKKYIPHGWRHPKNKMARCSLLNSADLKHNFLNESDKCFTVHTVFRIVSNMF
jgi:hypothetical protein